MKMNIIEATKRKIKQWLFGYKIIFLNDLLKYMKYLSEANGLAAIWRRECYFEDCVLVSRFMALGKLCFTIKNYDNPKLVELVASYESMELFIVAIDGLIEESRNQQKCYCASLIERYMSSELSDFSAYLKRQIS